MMQLNVHPNQVGNQSLSLKVWLDLEPMSLMGFCLLLFSSLATMVPKLSTTVAARSGWSVGHQKPQIRRPLRGESNRKRKCWLVKQYSTLRTCSALSSMQYDQLKLLSDHGFCPYLHWMLLHVPTFCMQEAVGAFGMRLTTHSQSPRLSYNIKDISSCASLSLKGYEDPQFVRYRTI